MNIIEQLTEARSILHDAFIKPREGSQLEQIVTQHQLCGDQTKCPLHRARKLMREPFPDVTNPLLSLAKPSAAPVPSKPASPKPKKAQNTRSPAPARPQRVDTVALADGKSGSEGTFSSAAATTEV
jgi:hypothetical protein